VGAERIQRRPGPGRADSGTPTTSGRSGTAVGAGVAHDVHREIAGAQRSVLPLPSPGRVRASAATVIHRKIAQSADPLLGPKAEIPDAALAGDVAANASDTLALVKAGTTMDAHPWVSARTKANGGKTPNSVKKNFKWKWPHRNRDGHLPGTPGAGGYDEYYINRGPNSSGEPTEWERLVVSTSTNDVFHTDNHYGDHGAPAFTHLGTTA